MPWLIGLGVMIVGLFVADARKAAIQQAVDKAFDLGLDGPADGDG